MSHPRSSFVKTIEVASNIAIVILAIVATVLLMRNYFFVRTSSRAVTQTASLREKAGPPAGPANGAKLSIDGIDWSESDQTVLLALSDNCHFCSQSAPFYQRLVNALANRRDVRLVALFPQQSDEAKKYLAKIEVPIADVRQASFGLLGVSGTPTVILVDRTGTIKQSWMGLLTSDRESEVLSRIKT